MFDDASCEKLEAAWSSTAEVVEGVVSLSCSRANPKFGEAGHEAKAAHPLPDCLEQMLQQKLLQGSKKDGLAELKEEVLTDMEVHTLFRRYRPELKRIFEATGRARGRRLFGKPMLTIEARRSGARTPDWRPRAQVCRSYV